MDKYKAWTTLRIYSGLLVAFYVLLTAKPCFEFLIVSIFFISAGEFWRVWASGYIQKDEKVTQSGPYALHRHPLYFGTFLIGLGLGIASGSWMSFALIIVVYIIIYIPTMRKEESSLLVKFPHSYQMYQTSVPAFFPRICPSLSPKNASRWSIRMVLHHREWKTVLLLLGMVVFLIMKCVFAGRPSC